MTEAELNKRASLLAEGRYLDAKKDYKMVFQNLPKKYEKGDSKE